MTISEYCLLALTILVCIFLLACAAREAAKCGEVWVSCPDLGRPVNICSFCYLLSERVQGHIRYYRFCDCLTGKTVQSFVSADCSLEQK